MWRKRKWRKWNWRKWMKEEEEDELAVGKVEEMEEE